MLLAKDSRLLECLESDSADIANLLREIVESGDQKDVIMNLQGEDAQSFLNLTQDVSTLSHGSQR